MCARERKIAIADSVKDMAEFEALTLKEAWESKTTSEERRFLPFDEFLAIVGKGPPN